MVLLLHNNKISTETTAINNQLFYCYYIFFNSLSSLTQHYITLALLNLQLVKKSLTTCDQALLIFLHSFQIVKSNLVAS